MVSSTPSPKPFRSALRRLLSRETIIVGGALLAAAMLAWAWLFALPMPGISPQPISASYLAQAFAMWSIMMVAMMVPSAIPMILLRASIDRAPSVAARTTNSLIFAVGYILVWIIFSAAAAFAQALLVRTGAVTTMNLTLGSHAVASGLLLLAALYELTAAKRLCLDKCQSPLLFMLNHFKPGATGAIRLGLVHGVFCLGCCWSLMLLLFVGGVMNLAWVAVLGFIVLGEKWAPPRLRLQRYIAAVLALGAIVNLVA